MKGLLISLLALSLFFNIFLFLMVKDVNKESLIRDKVISKNIDGLLDCTKGLTENQKEIVKFLQGIQEREIVK